MSVCVCLFVHVCVHEFMCVYVHMYACMYVYVYVSVHVFAHSHTRTAPAKGKGRPTNEILDVSKKFFVTCVSPPMGNLEEPARFTPRNSILRLFVCMKVEGQGVLRCLAHNSGKWQKFRKVSALVQSLRKGTVQIELTFENLWTPPGRGTMARGLRAVGVALLAAAT